MPYLLDTNVVAEAMRAQPDTHVMTWLVAQSSAAVYLSVLTIGEIEQGIVRSAHPRRAERLRRWLHEDLIPGFGTRILAVDAAVMRQWGQITGRASLQGRPVGLVDSLLAATAITHGLILANRNARDVAALPVQTVNPWGEAS
jgi:predicted nucleic acid-binding protein